MRYVALGAVALIIGLFFLHQYTESGVRQVEDYADCTDRQITAGNTWEEAVAVCEQHKVN